MLLFQAILFLRSTEHKFAQLPFFFNIVVWVEMSETKIHAMLYQSFFTVFVFLKFPVYLGTVHKSSFKVHAGVILWYSSQRHLGCLYSLCRMNSVYPCSTPAFSLLLMSIVRGSAWCQSSWILYIQVVDQDWLSNSWGWLGSSLSFTGSRGVNQQLDHYPLLYKENI